MPAASGEGQKPTMKVTNGSNRKPSKFVYYANPKMESSTQLLSTPLRTENHLES
jgi:hypothetical protein